MSGCAQSADGSLLDADQIKWYHDADDTTPMSPHLAATSSSTNSLDDYFTSRAPTLKVAGAHRSTRTVRPSKKVNDPDNAVGIDGSLLRPVAGQKRKATEGNPARRVARKVVSDSDANDTGDAASITDSGDTDQDRNSADATDSEGDKDEDTNGRAAYEAMKAMGGADHEVCALAGAFNVGY